jgi:hypothetical protein
MQKFFLGNDFINFIIIFRRSLLISHLKHRRLVIIDSLPKLNKKSHVNIHDKEGSLGYLAITTLLHPHESQLNND